MHLSRLARLTVAGSVFVLSGCQDLAVENTNQPDRRRAVATPEDVEALAAAQFLVLYTRLNNGSTIYNPVPLLADEMTGTYANDGALEISSEPRVRFNNGPQAEVSGIAVFAWRNFNSMISSANDALLAIEDGLVIETDDEDNTHRTVAWSKFIRALGHGYLAMFYDSAFVVREPVARALAKADSTSTSVEYIRSLPLHGYQTVMDSAIIMMEDAIAEAEAETFTLPSELYFRTMSVSSATFVRLMHSYIARFLVYNARTPEEREAVDWAKVKFHAERGITADFTFTLASGVLTSTYLSRIQNSGSFPAHADYKMVGPADTSGNYQAWIAKPLSDRVRFNISTPDKRITGATPTSAGAYFRYRSGESGFTRSRGIYHFSSYQWFRNAGRSSSGTQVWFGKAELNLLLAEAEFFLGNTKAAAKLVNISRTGTAAKLPPIDTVTFAVPGGNGCVPQLTDGTCGSLYDALIYERTIEAAGTDGMRAYLDARGSGRLPEGTIVHIPLPAAERIALDRPVYTYGGVGGDDAAAKCTVPTLTCHPQHP